MLDYTLFIDPELDGKIVISDPTRITQVLLNLIYNAIKFTNQGRISLSARSVAKSKDRITVQFAIQDTGIGISPEKQQTIFEPFIQASSSTTRNYGGTGLGLSIVKKTLDMFGSKITIESEEEVGSKFTFEIEFDYILMDESKGLVATNLDNDLSGLRVLVAEDNSINRMVIEKILKRWNITPVLVHDGLSALQIVEEQDFDVILMDLHMPIMDGYQSATSIRNLKNSVKANIPIIALTASANENVSQNVANAQMNDYLSKPFNPDHLFAKLKQISVGCKL